MELLIALLCGLIAYGIVMYSFFKALKKTDLFEQIATAAKMPWLAEALWWAFPFIFLWIVVETVQGFATFMNWWTSL